MKSKLFQRALFAATLLSLVACGSGKKKGKDPDSELESVADAGSEKFNLARFLRESPKTKNLKKSIGEGDAYIFFGEKNKFRIETNMNLDTQGEKGYFMGGPRAIGAGYWLDGLVFGKRIGGAAPRGYLVDLGAIGNLETISLDAHVRFLGQDKFKGKVASIWEDAITRDLNFEPVFYPVPMLGVKVGGNVGGELGLRTEMGVKTASTMGLLFRPVTKMNAGLSGGIEVLKFLSASIRGVVSVLTFDLGSGANLGYLKPENFSYGNTGVDMGDIKALDGKVMIVAKAEKKGILPFGIDVKLWDSVMDAAGIDVSDWEWSHTVWDPAPVMEKDLPSYGNSFMKFSKAPVSLADCQEKVELINAALDQNTQMIEDHGKKLKGVDASLSKHSAEYLQEVKTKVSAYCKQY